MILLRGLWSLFVGAVTLVGVMGGAIVHTLVQPKLPDNLSTLQATSFHVGLLVVGGLVGFLVSVYSFRSLVHFVNRMETVSLLDKVAAVLGVLLGLTVSLLATTPLATASFGLPIRIFVAMVFVILGVGFTISAKQQIVYVFPSLATRTPVTEDQAPARSKMLDTNIIIDGRIADICGTGFLEGPVLVPGFVLRELHHIADSADSLKRARGRRGLEVLNRLKKMPNADVRIFEEYPASDLPGEDVDVRLVKLAKELGAGVVTNDYSVNEIAKLHNVKVLNVNELAGAMRPVYLPGEEVMVTIVKEGKEPGQGVAYLDDGTMVVVEHASKFVGQTVPAVVTSALQTSAGKMIFSDLATDDAPPKAGRK
ncbi:TRAM domain-containing protein [bacterium]|nr:TRAM domain-containing protein [bacterium]